MVEEMAKSEKNSKVTLQKSKTVHQGEPKDHENAGRRATQGCKAGMSSAHRSRHHHASATVHPRAQSLVLRPRRQGWSSSPPPPLSRPSTAAVKANKGEGFLQGYGYRRPIRWL